MKIGRAIRIAAAAALLALPVIPQEEQEGVRLPSGKLQRDELLKVEHEKSLQDAAKIQEVARDLEAELKEKGPSVLSNKVIKQTEEIEKLAKRIKGRMRRS